MLQSIHIPAILGRTLCLPGKGGGLTVVRVYKGRRQLLALEDDGTVALEAHVALGREPVGPKEREGDGKTPEGVYTLCLVKEAGRHGQSLGLSYPGPLDGAAALAQGRIDAATYEAIASAHLRGVRPPWGSPLGGEIYIHGGGIQGDWTQGCIALRDADMARLFPLADRITRVEILP